MRRYVRTIHSTTTRCALANGALVVIVVDVIVVVICLLNNLLRATRKMCRYDNAHLLLDLESRPR